MIKVENINKSFGQVDVLKDVSLNIAAGEVVSIVGPSGAGKTTLLQIIGTLSRQDSGRVLINGIDLNTIGDKKLSRFRNQNIGFVFQFHNLLGEFTALENVCIPAYIAGSDRNQTEKRAVELLELLG
ncbi:MAG: ATP-binding cassette domain-containing protein, partial [Rikenellaceae bacterium]|nr:ATP-binding cassette domain-containing protein [Rikenellaceae bacterium]